MRVNFTTDIGFKRCNAFETVQKSKKSVGFGHGAVEPSYRIGIDIGGTDIKIGIVDNQGKITTKTSISTNKSPKEAISSVLENINKIMQEKGIAKNDIKGIGIGFPGQVDCEEGIIKNAVNLPEWKGFNIKEHVIKEFGKTDVKVDNDANCAAAGEQKYGAAKGCKDAICITVGTGIGGGIISNGQIVHGPDNYAAEVGHVKLNYINPRQCGCGGKGCIESEASISAIERAASEYYKSIGKNSGKDEINPKAVEQKAKEGEEWAQKIYDDVGTKLGKVLANIVTILNPEAVVVGGGVSKAGDLLLKPIEKAIKENALNVSADRVKVVRAQLGNDAGLVGASSLIA